MSDVQFIRKSQLLVTGVSNAIDLSNLRFTFQIKAADVESPTNAWFRVFNLAPTTIALIRKEYTRVVLQAGYGENVGTIFEGTIKQYRIGRVDGTTTYFDILAADGDIPYNSAVMSKTLAAGSTIGQRASVAVDSMRQYGITGQQLLLPETGGVLPRGKVLFGMARLHLRTEALSAGATWNIQNGVVKIIPNEGYSKSQVVVLNGQTGLIGRPEQTVDGIRARCLINPRITVGGRVQIDNKIINQTLQQDPNGAPLVYDKWAGLQFMANIASDGIYRVYVIEYDGDTRGNEWYADLTLLAIDATNNKVTIE